MGTQDTSEDIASQIERTGMVPPEIMLPALMAMDEYTTPSGDLAKADLSAAFAVGLQAALLRIRRLRRG